MLQHTVLHRYSIRMTSLTTWEYLFTCTHLCSYNMYLLRYSPLNPYHAEFFKWNNPSYIFNTVHYHFKGYQDWNLKLVSQQYRAWSDWWQRLFTFGVGRIRVNIFMFIRSILHSVYHLSYWMAVIWNLTLNLLNFLNGIIHHPFLELSIFILRGIKMRTWSLLANRNQSLVRLQECAG